MNKYINIFYNYNQILNNIKLYLQMKLQIKKYNNKNKIYKIINYVQILNKYIIRI